VCVREYVCVRARTPMRVCLYVRVCMFVCKTGVTEHLGAHGAWAEPCNEGSKPFGRGACGVRVGM